MKTQEIIKSVGIDIGTSTTQLVFSRLTIENLASSYTVPRISIVKKEVTYRSDIYFTPLRSATEIDVDAVKSIIQGEYHKAGISPDDLQTGAVIITGETARKENANQVLEALSNLAGNFVVATAGPNLESVLAARGAGTDKLAEEHRMTICNLDVGGGTSNLAVYQKQRLIGTSCLDIGGRLIKVDKGTITYVYPKIQKLAKSHGIIVQAGQRADISILRQICGIMADQLAQAIHCKPMDEEHRGLYTNNGNPLPDNVLVQGVTFSGGVADYVYRESSQDYFKYGDIGILLGEAIRSSEDFSKIQRYDAAETIRATVVGAGTHTVDVSGSTVAYVKEQLPMKNIPVLKIPREEEQDLEELTRCIQNQMPLFISQGEPEQIAISFSGYDYTRFLDVQKLAEALIRGCADLVQSRFPLVFVVENDIGKVLGNAINVQLDRRKDVICLDCIHTQSGDYIDIGEPVAGGRVVPVVIKTLIFNS